MGIKRMVTAAAVAGALTGGVAAAGPAAAAPSAQDSGRDFIVQAEQAGLTKAQARKLQAEVDHHRSVYGGKQVAPNKIELAGGTAELTVPVPGERYVRDLTRQAAGVPPPQHGCNYYHFCMYRGIGFTNLQLALKACNEVALRNWVELGSYVNHQTPGTYAMMYFQNHIGGVGSRAYGENPIFDWYPIWYVDPC